MAIIPPDWNMILNKPGDFSQQERACAAQWETCAIGEGAHRFPTVVQVDDTPWHEPLDATLIAYRDLQSGAETPFTT